MEQKSTQLENQLKKLQEFNLFTNNPNIETNPTNFRFSQVETGYKGKVQVGSRCKGVVVGKDMQRKQLEVHLTYLMDQNEKFHMVNDLQFKSFIHDYNLRQTFSIFTYVDTLTQLKLGTQIDAVILREECRSQQIFYELKLIYDNHSSSTIRGPRYGSSQILSVYQESKQLPLNFLALYAEDFNNPGLANQLMSELKITNTWGLTIQGQSLLLSRVHEKQDSNWSQEHFIEGMALIKAEKPQLAIEHLDVAKSFNPKNSKIYVAKGCALANMNNLAQGYKEIKQALSLSPDNKQAQQYYNTLRNNLNKNKEDGETNGRKLKKIDYTYPYVHRSK